MKPAFVLCCYGTVRPTRLGEENKLISMMKKQPEIKTCLNQEFKRQTHREYCGSLLCDWICESNSCLE